MNVSLEGWMLFCPVWANDRHEVEAKYHMDLILWAVIEMQQWFNVIADFVCDDWEPVFCLYLRPCEKFYLD